MTELFARLRHPYERQDSQSDDDDTDDIEDIVHLPVPRLPMIWMALIAGPPGRLLARTAAETICRGA
jgi:hypothetical protein